MKLPIIKEALRRSSSRALKGRASVACESGEAQRQEAAMATRHLNLGIPAHEDHDVIAQCVREDELPGDAVFDDVFFDADGTVWDTYQSADGRWWATLAEEDTEPDPCCQ